MIGRRSRCEDWLVERQPATGELCEAFGNHLPFFFRVSARYETRNGQRTGIDHGVVQTVATSIGRDYRVEGKPGCIDPDKASDFLRSDSIEHDRQHEWLRDAHDGEGGIDIAYGKDLAAGGGDGNAEEIGIDLRQGRIAAWNSAISHEMVSGIGILDPGAHGVRNRQSSR